MISAGRYQWNVSDDTSETTVELDNDPVAETWYFWCVWHDAVNNEIGIRLDDEENTQSYSDGLSDGNAAFQIGGFPGNYMDGEIDEVGFWKRVLTQSERDILYNLGNAAPYPFKEKKSPGILTNHMVT